MATESIQLSGGRGSSIIADLHHPKGIESPLGSGIYCPYVPDKSIDDSARQESGLSVNGLVLADLYARGTIQFFVIGMLRYSFR
jgi:hypothetical protein